MRITRRVSALALLVGGLLVLSATPVMAGSGSLSGATFEVFVAGSGSVQACVDSSANNNTYYLQGNNGYESAHLTSNFCSNANGQSSYRLCQDISFQPDPCSAYVRP